MMCLIVSSLLIASGPVLADPVEGTYEQVAKCWSNNDAEARAHAQVYVHTHDLLYDLEASAYAQIGPYEKADADEAAGVHPIQGGWQAEARATLSKNSLPDETFVKADAAYDGNSVSQEGDNTIFQSVDRDDRPETVTCGASAPNNLPSPSTYTSVRLEVGTDCTLHVDVNDWVENDGNELTIVCDEETT